MKLIFSDSPFPEEVTKSLFLAGPTERIEVGGFPSTHTWRHQAVVNLTDLGYDGVVYIPVPEKVYRGTGPVTEVVTYEDQIKWETDAMSRADYLFFGVCRTEEQRGMTTNIEFGKYVSSHRMVYCRPKDTPHTRYMDYLARDNSVTVYADLKEALGRLLDKLGEGSLRKGPECLIPLLYWSSEQFQSWYQNLLNAGNRLEAFVPKVTVAPNTLFGYAAWVKVYVAKDDRYVSNEWIFSRTTVSYIVPYYRTQGGGLEVCLVSEFRSAANNPQQYIYEFPGGSSPNSLADALSTAADELYEETGVFISDKNRFKPLGERQTFATFNTMRLNAYSIELDQAEINQLKSYAEEGKILGANEGERITLHVVDAKELVLNPEAYPVDLTTLGLVHLLHSSLDL